MMGITVVSQTPLIPWIMPSTIVIIAHENGTSGEIARTI